MALRIYHCVQVGSEESFDRAGSSRWRDARKLATAAHRDNPDEEVRIVSVLVDDRGIVQGIEAVKVIYGGNADMEAGIRAGLWNFFN